MKQKLSVAEFILSIIVIGFSFLFPHFGIIPIPFAYTIPVLLIIWLLLKKTKENFTNLGFSVKRFEWRAVAWGAVCSAMLILFLRFVFFPLLTKIIILPEANLDDFKSIQHNLQLYLFILLMAWLVGGFYEELVFHGFIFTRIEKMITSKYAAPAGFFITNLIFGLYHFQQGITGVIHAFIAGCAYQLLMMKFNRNLWYAIFIHAFYDSIALTLIYLGYK